MAYHRRWEMARSRAAVLMFAAVLASSLVGCNKGEETNTSVSDGGWCDAISDYASPADCADFTKQAELQVEGTAAFNAPNPVKRGKTFSVWLAVAANPPPPVPAKPAKPSIVEMARPEPASTDAPSDTPTDAGVAATEEPAALPPPSAPETAAPPTQVVAAMPGHTETFAVVVGRYVAADLQGDEAFEITNKSDRTQSIRLGPPYPSTIWRWDVKALHGGDHVMVIKTVIQVKDREGKFHDVVATTQPYSFHVQVGVLGWLQDTLTATPGWIKLLTGVILALALLVGAIEKLRNAVLSLFGKKPKAPVKASGGSAKKPPK